jgi:hypothetical protein
MNNIYCGNNSLDSRLVSGKEKLGTNYTCLKKGIGRGLSLPLDKSYSKPYIPIDNTKIYCGKKKSLPSGYDRNGNLVQCLQKGVGIGKNMKAKRSKLSNKSSSLPPLPLSPPPSPPKNESPYLAFKNTIPFSSIPSFHIWSSFAVHVYMIIIISVLVFLIMYFRKPFYVLDKRDDDKKVINWKKFIIAFIIIMLFNGILLTISQA